VCGSCWDEAGSPTEWTPETARFIELRGALYLLEPVGGPLHVVLDDWNLGGVIEPYWSALNCDLDDDDPDAVRIRELCTEIAAILNGWTEPQRYAAMAYADNFVPRPAS
jgi:hypothetical protein